jgi:hypothetical protein
MVYWSILAAKLVVGGSSMYGLLYALAWFYNPPDEVTRWGHSPFLHDLRWTTMMFLYFLVCQGVLFLIVLDQKYRCRTCGRRLRMPVSRGRYAHMLLFGRPTTEYICIYGHGTLNVPELHFSGREPNNWKAHDEDMWKELYSYDEKK